MDTPQAEKPSVEQLNDMLRGVMAPAQPSTEQPEPVVETPAAATPEPAETPAPETATAAPQTETETEAPAEVAPSLDDLKAQYEAQLAEARRRGSEGISWARNLGLRKASEADRYRKTLEKLVAGEELSQDDVRKVLEAQVNLPAEFSGPQVTNPLLGQARTDEAAAADAAQFALDAGITVSQGEAFQKWLSDPQSPIAQRDIVDGNAYATLAILYGKFKDTQKAESKVVAKAAASVARTQRDVAKAAASAPARSAPPAPKQTLTDPMKMSSKERIDKGLVHNWLKEVMGQ